MAYVVVRPMGRFEIRESVHTPQGPRARTLANFEILTDKVLETARQRASRPFHLDAVRTSAAKASDKAAAKANARRVAAMEARHAGLLARGGRAPLRGDLRRFVEASHRMAAAIEPKPPTATSRQDPGDALIDLLGVAAQVAAFRPLRPAEPLRFPPLARLQAARAGAAAN